MYSSPNRFSQLRWLQTLVCLLAVLGGFLLIGLGLVDSSLNSRGWLIIVGGAGVFLSVMVLSITPLLLKIESTLARQLGEFRDLNEAMGRQIDQLQAIGHNTRISDAAKSLTHREQELEALRAAIRDDIRNEKWEAALNLVSEIDRRFGYKQEADRIREELEEARQEAIQSKLSEAVDLIERQFQLHQWERAEREIDRLLHALPNDLTALGLRQRMKELKLQHKGELKKSWEDAVRRNDTDHAIDILKEMDQYMSVSEAQTLQESARHVFKEKLLQLGVQFRFAVTERRWQDALDTGLELIRDFPNARMANEVREALDTLREKARQGAGAAVGAKRS